MNAQEFEQFLLYELLDGHPDDVLCHMTAADIGEEFSQMLWVWSQHHQNPIQLRDNLQRFIIGMINRTVKAKNLPAYDETDDDRYFEHQGRLYQEHKDREAENYFKGKEA